MKIKPCESRIVFVTCRRIGAGKSSQKVFKQCRVVSYSIQAEEFRQFFLKKDVSQQKEKTSQVTCYKRKKWNRRKNNWQKNCNTNLSTVIFQYVIYSRIDFNYLMSICFKIFRVGLLFTVKKKLILLKSDNIIITNMNKKILTDEIIQVYLSDEFDNE